MADGRVRLRSNVAADPGLWTLVPGELVAVHRKELLQPPNRAPWRQVEERMYYEPCSRCGRRINEINLEGCDECPDGPNTTVLERARERHVAAVAALEAARAELRAEAVTADEPPGEPARASVDAAPEAPNADRREDQDATSPSTAPTQVHTCIVPGCTAEGRNKLGVRCRVWHDGPYPLGKGKTAALWAPDADAFLCDEHALGGATITLLYEPDESKQTTVRVIGARHTEPRSVPIKHVESGSRRRPPFVGPTDSLPSDSPSSPRA